MADGIVINTGTGPTIAAELIGTASLQRIKLAVGNVDTDGGDVSATNPIPMTGSVSATLVGTSAVTAANVTVASVATGTVSISSMPNVTVASISTGTVNLGIAQYGVASTNLGTTGQGLLFIGIQTGSTAAQPVAVTTTGAAYTVFAGTQAVTAANVTVASITTGTVNVINVLSASNVTIASVTTGTMNVINVLSASGVTVASVATGTVSISGTPNVVITTTTLGAAGGIVATAHASRFQAFVIATTSAGGGVIVKTSGANTLYITDLLVSVTGPMSVILASETTTIGGPVYLAANGGWVENCVQPYVCNSAQSLRVILSSSGACSVTVRGYTVT